MKRSLFALAENTATVATPKNVKPLARLVWFQLQKQKKLSAVDKFIEILEEKSSQRQGKIKAYITSAKELNKSELGAIKLKLEKKYLKPVDIDTKLDPYLLGGYKIKTGDEVVDYSWRGKINSLKIKLKAGG